MRAFHALFVSSLLCLLALSPGVFGRTLIVPDDYLYIQDAVYDARDGDTVHIRSNLYYETSISIGKVNTYDPPERKAITIRGEGIGKTIIDGSKGSFDIFVVNAPLTIIRDMTIQNSKGAGITFRGKGALSIVVNCECRGNRTGIQSVIDVWDRYFKTASPLIIGNWLVDNQYYGLYLENGCEAEAMHNWVEGNGYAAAYCRMDRTGNMCEPLIRNNFFINGPSVGNAQGIVVAGGAEPTIRNNIFRGFATGCYWYEDSSPDEFVNNVIMQCGVGGEAERESWIDYCLFYDNVTDMVRLRNHGHLITGEDPLFVDADNHDYHLMPASPCVDSGDDNLPDGSSETDADGSDIDMGVYGGKEVGPTCRIVLSEPSKEMSGLGHYFTGESYEDLNGNGEWDMGEPFEDFNDNGVWDEEEPFTDENHNGFWDAGEPYTDLDYDGRHDTGEPFTDLNGNERWDEQREPYDDVNRNDSYDRGAFLCYIALFSCFGETLDSTSLYAAVLLETGDLFTFDSDCILRQGIYPNLTAFVGPEFTYCVNALSIRLLYGFPLVNQTIGLYTAMGPSGNLVGPWDALTGVTIKLSEAE